MVSPRRAIALVGVALVLAAGALELPTPESASGGGGSRSLIASDTAARRSPIRFWGKIDCEKRSRHRWIRRGGDWRPTALGFPQGNSAFRRLTVLDGDDVYGERCELGRNNRHSPVTFYREGRRRITYLSIRLRESFPLKTSHWQGVMQMKQATPADNAGGAPVLSLGAYAGRWFLFNSAPGYSSTDHELWSRPARRGVWTRFAFDVRYSRKRSRGRVTVYADLDHDGDFADRGERSRRFHTNTLKREIAGTSRDGRRTGQSLPSHLRVGIYHDSVIRCPRPRGCSVDVDNVQVVRP